jgi:hypothetical protein
MARAAPHTGRTAIVRTSRDAKVMDTLFIALSWRIAARVTVDTARAAQHGSDLDELRRGRRGRRRSWRTLCHGAAGEQRCRAEQSEHPASLHFRRH